MRNLLSLDWTVIWKSQDAVPTGEMCEFAVGKGNTGFIYVVRGK
jgi:hypothetical protein